jgi:pimeloyl-ACP methyl ester carboxylesterase
MKNSLLVICFVTFLSPPFQYDDPQPTGRLIDIGGYKLHIDARGSGSPAVIMISGATAFSFDWELVLPQIAKFTRACTYDRPALAWSEPGPSPRSFDQDVYELRQLLQKAGIKPPYILVGHSLGGIIARKFEKQYPNEVKGLVLVDPTSEDAVLFINNEIKRLRLLSQNKPIPGIKSHVDSFTKLPSKKEVEDFRKMVGEQAISPPFDKLPIRFQKIRLWAMNQPKIMIADNGGFWAEEFAAMYADSLYTIGNKPLFILSSGKNIYSKEADEKMREISTEKLIQREKMSMLSSNSKHIITTKSGHEIHLEEPELVINAIKEVFRSVKTGKPLKQ